MVVVLGICAVVVCYCGCNGNLLFFHCCSHCVRNSFVEKRIKEN